MSYDWRAARERAILQRRREGRWPRTEGAYVNRPLRSYNDLDSTGFYARWAFDNVIEMLATCDPDSIHFVYAAAMIQTLIDYDHESPYLAEYQRASVTAPSLEE